MPSISSSSASRVTETTRFSPVERAPGRDELPAGYGCLREKGTAHLGGGKRAGGKRQDEGGRWGPYRQASPPPARPRPGARSARRERCLSIVSQTSPPKESPDA